MASSAAGISSFDDEYLGPVSFYRRMDHRQKKNPFLLRRCIRFASIINHRHQIYSCNCRQKCNQVLKSQSSELVELSPQRAAASFDPKIYFHFLCLCNGPSSEKISSTGNVSKGYETRIQESRWLRCPLCRFTAFSNPDCGTVKIGKTESRVSQDGVDEGALKRRQSGNASSTGSCSSSISADWTAETTAAVAVLIGHLHACHEYLHAEAVKCPETLSLHISFLRSPDCAMSLRRLKKRDRSSERPGSPPAKKSKSFVYVARREGPRSERTKSWIKAALRGTWPLKSVSLVQSAPKNSRVTVVRAAESAGRETSGGAAERRAPPAAAPRRNMTYYHRNGFPYPCARDGGGAGQQEPLTYDSENDEFDYAMTAAADAQIAEFSDLFPDEKAFMMLWNAHVRSFPPYSDGFMGYATEIFAKRFAATIVERKLRYSFLVFLIYLWKVSLVRSSELKTALQIVDEHQVAVLTTIASNRNNATGRQLEELAADHESELES
jgi:hypothetical protein